MKDFGHLDLGVVDALMRYVALGLRPGSFTEALLRGDIADAYSRAHPALTQGSDVVASLYCFVEQCVPLFAQKEHVSDWLKHDGLSGATEAIRSTVRITVEEPHLLNMVKKSYPQLV